MGLSRGLAHAVAEAWSDAEVAVVDVAQPQSGYALSASEVLRQPSRERQRQLLTLIRNRGHLNVTGVAVELGVSVETTRRDLNVLEQHGLIRRSYGTAYPVDSVGFETDLAHRSVELVAEKKRIAIFAAQQLQDAESVFIDEGFLPLRIAEAMPIERKVTVVTASIPVAAELSPRPDYTVIMLGGRVRGGTLATVDHWVSKMLREFSIDLAFVGANGISTTAGPTTPEPVVSEVKAAAIRASRRRIFVGTHTKFRMTSFSKFAEVSDFEMLITDTKLSAAEALRFSVLGPDVVRV
jgi:DeoR family transcriptional regulator, fructose operon transcriptional repressor